MSLAAIVSNKNPSKFTKTKNKSADAKLPNSFSNFFNSFKKYSAALSFSSTTYSSSTALVILNSSLPIPLSLPLTSRAVSCPQLKTLINDRIHQLFLLIFPFLFYIDYNKIFYS